MKVVGVPPAGRTKPIKPRFGATGHALLNPDALLILLACRLPPATPKTNQRTTAAASPAAGDSGRRLSITPTPPQASVRQSQALAARRSTLGSNGGEPQACRMGHS